MNTKKELHIGESRLMKFLNKCVFLKWQSSKVSGEELEELIEIINK